ncbi:MAG: cupin-like domain-containing protein [Fischerella sp. CENA71]|nr:cupin-like domain-containing protein [Fischerella sp. CENA71]
MTITTISSSAIDRIENPSEAFFRKNYVERSRPVVIVNTQPRPAQMDWNFEYLSRVAGDHFLPVYDWGDKGPTVNDDFVIRQMKLAELIEYATRVISTSNQRYSICQLALEEVPPLAQEYQTPTILENAERLDRLPAPFRESRRIALFISFFRGIHWHNGREVLAQLLTGRKKFVLYHPKDSRFLYPRKLIDSGLAWFDETEAVFCSEIPFENGIENIDRRRFPLFEQATPIEVELKAGESLYIPTHWWHFTNALEPCIVIADFWDAPLHRWGYPIAWRSLLMKPYRKYLYRRLLRFKMFSRNQQVLKTTT